MPRRPFLPALFAFAILSIAPCSSRAGDCSLYTINNWGVGKIDNRLMFYLGHDHYLITPIPSPPEGPRWDIVYRMLPGMALYAIAVYFMASRPLRADIGPPPGRLVPYKADGPRPGAGVGRGSG